VKGGLNNLLDKHLDVDRQTISAHRRRKQERVLPVCKQRTSNANANVVFIVGSWKMFEILWSQTSDRTTKANYLRKPKP